MAVFKSCCCCLSLRTGCIVIGVLEILMQLSNLASNRSTPTVMFGTLVGLVTCALLIYGAVKRNRFCLWPWIVVNIITLIVLTVGVIMCAFASAIMVDVFKSLQEQGGQDISQQDQEDAKAFMTTLVVMIAVVLLIAIAITILLTLVVYSYVCELREEEERQQNDTNAPPKAYNLVPV